MPESGPWDCEAYGPDGAEHGALCFFGGQVPQHRVCSSLADCHQRMTAERQRVFQRIQERAAEGDPDSIYLAEVFKRPEQLLGGPESGELPGA